MDTSKVVTWFNCRFLYVSFWIHFLETFLLHWVNTNWERKSWRRHYQSTSDTNSFLRMSLRSGAGPREREERNGDGQERVALFGLKRLREPIKGRELRGRWESLAACGDVQLRLRPGEETAGKHRKRTFETACEGWVRRKGGRGVERALGLDE